MPQLPPEFAHLLSTAGKGTLQMAGLLLARIIPIVSFTPLFGGEVVPRRMRFGLAILLTLGFLLAFQPLFDRSFGWIEFWLLIVKEALIGYCLSLFIVVFFEIFTAFGGIVDLARGATQANILDPLTHSQDSALALFFTQLAIVLFFAVGGHRLMLEALGDSFVVLKPGDPLPLRLLGTATTFNFISLTADLFLIAFRLSTPVLVVLLVLDVALGLTNRVAPQIQVNFVSMEIKASLGLFVILVTFALLINVEFPVVIQAVRRWLAAFQT